MVPFRQITLIFLKGTLAYVKKKKNRRMYTNKLQKKMDGYIQLDRIGGNRLKIKI